MDKKYYFPSETIGEFNTNSEIAPKPPQKVQVIQLKITEKRKAKWEQWLKQSKYEIPTQVMWEALETALASKEMLKDSKPYLLVSLDSLIPKKE